MTAPDQQDARQLCTQPVTRNGQEELCGHPVVDGELCGYHRRSAVRRQAKQDQRDKAAGRITGAQAIAATLTKAGLPSHNYGPEISMTVETATKLLERLGIK